MSTLEIDRDLSTEDVARLLPPLEKFFKRLNPRVALTVLAKEGRAIPSTEGRYSFLKSEYGVTEGAPAILRGKPRCAAYIALSVMACGLSEMRRPMRNVVKTVGDRDEEDPQLVRRRFADVVRSFTTRPSEIQAILARRFDGCLDPKRDSAPDSAHALARRMTKTVLSPKTGLFMPVGTTTDRYAIGFVEPLREAIEHPYLKWAVSL